MELTDNMCELIGSIIGNGNIRDGRPWFVEMTGDSIEELTYFEDRLKPIVFNELNYNPRMYFHSGALRFKINSKEFVLWLKSLGMPTRKLKCHNVLIPEEICTSWEKTKNCIRGIFDTDGCVHFDKRRVYSQPYPRIELHMLNERLLEQIYHIMKKQGFNVTMSKKKPCIYMNGFKEVKKFLMKIGFANPKHHKRIKALYPNLITYNLI